MLPTNRSECGILIIKFQIDFVCQHQKFSNTTFVIIHGTIQTSGKTFLNRERVKYLWRKKEKDFLLFAYTRWQLDKCESWSSRRNRDTWVGERDRVPPKKCPHSRRIPCTGILRWAPCIRCTIFFNKKNINSSSSSSILFWSQ